MVKSDTENRELSWQPKELNIRQARWAEELSAYNFVFEHVERKGNVIANALSRRPDFKPETIATRTTRILKDVDGRLVLKKEIQLRMIKIKRNYVLDEEIKEVTKSDNRNLDIRKYEDGSRRLKGPILCFKEYGEER